MTIDSEPGPPVKKILDWEHWPQGIAPSVRWWMKDPRHRRRRKGALGRPYHKRLLGAATELIEKCPPLSLEDIVVFYPQRFHESVMRSMRRAKRKWQILGIKGLTISSTHRLLTKCMAFRISDVERHRTPADPYFIKITSSPHGGVLRPEPIYSEDENHGTAVHD